jgi:hypothetical protein
MGLAPRRIPIWNPAMSAMYKGRSLPHTGTWYPERQLIVTLNAHALLQRESKVRTLAYKKHWRPGRQPSHTGRFLLAVALKADYYCSNVS